MSDSSLLPPIDDSSSGTQADSSGDIQVPITIGLGPSSKEVMIGGGVLLLCTLIFFFMRNAYANFLAGSLKRSPNNAGLAAWALFGALFFGAAIGSIALISKSFLTVAYVAPLALLSASCLILCLVVTSRK